MLSMQNVQKWTLKWSPEVVFVPFFPLNPRLWFYEFMCRRLNTKVNLAKSSQKCSILSSLLMYLCYWICQTWLTFFVVVHTKKWYTKFYCVLEIFLFVLMHCKLKERRSNSLPIPYRVQPDSFTFATRNLHIIRICLDANTLTCKVSVT